MKTPQQATRLRKLRLTHTAFLAADASASFGMSRSDIITIPPLPRELSKDAVFAAQQHEIFKCRHERYAVVQRDKGRLISTLWLTDRCGLCKPPEVKTA